MGRLWPLALASVASVRLVWGDGPTVPRRCDGMCVRTGALTGRRRPLSLARERSERFIWPAAAHAPQAPHPARENFGDTGF